MLAKAENLREKWIRKTRIKLTKEMKQAKRDLKAQPFSTVKRAMSAYMHFFVE